MKYKEIANILREQVVHGDYVSRHLPAELDMVRDFGVSRVTVRKSIQLLIEEGVLMRSANSRICVRNGDKVSSRVNIAYLMPAFPCTSYRVTLSHLERVAEPGNATVRPVEYVHWNDPVIRETLNSYDGVFFEPLAEAMPEEVRRLCQNALCGVAVFNEDLSSLGIPSIFAYPSKYMSKMLDFLYALGHRKSRCLNTQPMEPLTRQRVDQYILWVKNRQLPLNLINQPVQSYEANWTAAYEIMKRKLDAATFDATAIVCTTQGVAMGAMRACYEKNIAIGTDVSICGINDDGTSTYLLPPLTCFLFPQGLPGYLQLCLEWMLRGRQNWIGPMVYEPAEDEFFRGKTTRPAPK